MITIEKDSPLFVGIDGGGTNCRVRIESGDGQLIATGHGGSANPSHGLSVVVDSIMIAINMAMQQANLPTTCLGQMIVGAGLAGLHLPSYKKVMKGWQHPFAALYLTHDLHVATIGAHDGKEGAVVIAGTGFSALSLVNGVETAIGGYGFLQADHCSGSWLGYQAVQAVLLAHDGLSPPTMLTNLLYEKYQMRGVDLVEHFVGATASQYGILAPLVFIAANQGDKAAQDMIENSVEFITRVIQLLLKTKPSRISLIGSVAMQLVKQFDQNTIEYISPAIESPEVGAVHYARQQHKS
jgi:glucosamine kinase